MFKKRDNSGHADRSFGGGNRRSFGGGGGFSRGGNGGGFNRGGSDRPMMHKTTCSECGNSCEVPFRPTGEKPVYCNSCFRRDEDGGSSNRYDNKRSFDRAPRQDNFREKSEYKPFVPKTEARTDNFNARLDDLSTKMDLIIKLLNSKKNENSQTIVVDKAQEAAVQAKIEKKKTAEVVEAPKKAAAKKATPAKVEEVIAPAKKKATSKKK